MKKQVIVLIGASVAGLLHAACGPEDRKRMAELQDRMKERVAVAKENVAMAVEDSQTSAEADAKLAELQETTNDMHDDSESIKEEYNALAKKCPTTAEDQRAELVGGIMGAQALQEAKDVGEIEPAEEVEPLEFGTTEETMEIEG